MRLTFDIPDQQVNFVLELIHKLGFIKVENAESIDWSQDLSPEQIQSIMQGQKDIEEGRTTSLEDMEKELDDRLNSKGN